jgi:hypothetical protein
VWSLFQIGRQNPPLRRPFCENRCFNLLAE